MNQIMDRLEAVELDEVVGEAITAAKAAAGNDWDDLSEYVEKSAKNLLSSGVMIAKLLAQGKIDQDDARQLAEEERIVIRMQLRTIAGVTLLAAQNVINAIVGVISKTVNEIIGAEVF